jgi:hypothetical protein
MQVAVLQIDNIDIPAAEYAVGRESLLFCRCELRKSGRRGKYREKSQGCLDGKCHTGPIGAGTEGGETIAGLKIHDTSFAKNLKRKGIREVLRRVLGLVPQPGIARALFVRFYEATHVRVWHGNPTRFGYWQLILKVQRR